MKTVSYHAQFCKDLVVPNVFFLFLFQNGNNLVATARVKVGNYVPEYILTSWGLVTTPTVVAEQSLILESIERWKESHAVTTVYVSRVET